MSKDNLGVTVDERERINKEPRLIVTLKDQDAEARDKDIPEIFSYKPRKGAINKDEGTINDPRLGVMGSGNCVVCGYQLKPSKPGERACPGHPGKIIFKKPFYHEQWISKVIFLLNVFNFSDYLESYKSKKDTSKINIRFRYDTEDFKNRTKNIANFSSLSLFMKTLKVKHPTSDIFVLKDFQNKKMKSEDKVKNAQRFTIAIQMKSKNDVYVDVDEAIVYSFLSKLGEKGTSQNEVLKLLGFDESINPKFLMIKVLTVLPNKLKSSIAEKGMRSQNKFNNYYSAILKAKEAYENTDSVSKKEEALERLYKNYNNLINSKSDPDSSIKAKMTGKESIIRRRVLGGSFPKVGRCTIVGTTDCPPDTVFLGKYYAERVTSLLTVTKENFRMINEWVSKGMIEKFESESTVEKVKKVAIFDDEMKLITTLSKSGDFSEFMSQLDKGNVIKGGEEDFIYDAGDVSTMRKMRRVEELSEGQLDISKKVKEMLEEHGKITLYAASNFLYKADIKIGDKIQKPIMDGDIIFINRYPTLGPQSWLAVPVVIDHKDIYVIKLHLSMCEGAHADFDGDEMHFQLPLTQETAEELKEKARFYKTMRLDKDGTIVNGFIQNPFAIMFLLSKEDKDYRFTEKEAETVFTKFINIGKSKNPAKPENAYARFKYQLNKHDIPLNSQRAILSSIFPESFNYANDVIKIKNGIILEGILTKSSVQSGQNSILQTISTVYDEEICINFIDNGYKLADAVTQIKGFSLSYSDIYLNETDLVKDMKSDIVKAFEKKVIKDKTYNHIIDELKKIKYGDYKQVKEKLNITPSQYQDLVEDLEERYIQKIAKKVGRKDVEDKLRKMNKIDPEKVKEEFNIDIDEAEIMSSIAEMYDKTVQDLMPKIMTKIRNTGNITKDDLDIVTEEDFKDIQQKIKDLSSYAKLSQMIDELRDKVTKAKDEMEIQRLTEKARSDIEKFAESYTKGNNFLTMAKSGTKGSVTDLAKITSTVGQFLNPYGLIPAPLKASPGTYGDILEENSYCTRSMTQGINVSDFVKYIISIRKQILDTYMATPIIGYALKRMRELVGNIVVDEKGLIRFGRRIILTKFGDFGLNVNRTVTVNRKQLPIDPLYLLSQYQ